MKAYTDLKQSKKLAEIIPRDSADMIWYGIYYGMDGQHHILSDEYNEFGPIAINKKFCKILFRLGDEHVDWLPAWSLSALLELIPSNIFLYSRLVKWDNSYYIEKREMLYDNPIDAVFEMVCWLKENGKI